MWCLGPTGAVGRLSRFLQSPDINPHATLLTLFMNAIPEMITDHEDASDLRHDMSKAMKYIPFTGLPGNLRDPRFLRLMEARSIFRDNDKYFNR